MDKYLGKRLDGRYEMNELIGVGGMAYVYKAYDCIDDRTVAVKILRDEFLTNEEFTRRFRNESKAIAILNHPNIVKVLDVGFGERLQYIVMEYIDGITLKEYLDQRKDIRWKEAVHFTVQILRALQHAHDKGIVHRDIKPQNIMLLSDGTIKVTDFGIARLSRTEVRATVDGEKAIGSVHYISPEQARGEITDEKADLYSVGVALYEMLTGKLPFEADNAVSVAIMQMQNEATPPHEINPDIPEGLEQITMRAMQKDLTKRYQSAAEMLGDFDEFKRNPSIKFEYTYFVDETPTRYVDAITRVRGESAEEEDDAAQEPTSKLKLSTVGILSAVAVSVVAVCLLFVFLFTGWLGGGGRENITVENFVGKSYEEEVLKMDGLLGKYDIKLEKGYNSEHPKGYVYKQEPAANSTIKSGGALVLYISDGERQEVVPLVTPGELEEDVKDRLVKAGFTVRRLEESSETIEMGRVIRLDPEGGTKADYGSEITVYVSSGIKEPDPIVMPEVTRLNEKDAIDALVKAGFSANKITVQKENNSAPAGTVLSVSPNGGEQKPDIDIVLTVSTGYVDAVINLPMPMTGTTVDLQFFFAGQPQTSLTQSYTGIVPQDIGTLKFTASLAQDNYIVTVKISEAGKNDFKLYASFDVNGNTGVATRRELIPFVESKPTDPTTTPSTDPTDAPVVSDTPNSSDVGADNQSDGENPVG